METPSRITAIFHATHELVGSSPVSISWNSSENLHSDEEPYEKRRLKVGPRKQLLDLNWLVGDNGPNLSYICIFNTTGMNRQNNPTAEEKEELAKQKIVLTFDDSKGEQNGLEIAPGMFNFISPNVVPYIHSAHGEATAHLFVVPS